ncbi:tyrosine-type recombinase/integrase [Pseudogemmobacter bohemicus]|uniref:tyrosine-type recombinase/integrase n=1 Tax=Pseudogemmobacter bohemicus TaxID=2250708 RepID=UPI000DD36630|nr:tyrosine-type recombinase/integrase [Pseudogemmobacter bohemicus]
MRRGLRSVKLKHLNPSGIWPSGNPRFYYRPKGKKGIPMPDLPIDHPAFLKAYAEAHGAPAPVVVRSGTLAAAVVAYKGSEVFRGLAASTRARRRTALDDILTLYGSGKVADLEDRHIRKDLERFQTHARNGRLKIWRAFCAWMATEYKLPASAAATLSRVKVPKSDGHIPWDGEQISQFRAFWPIGSVERLAFELLYWTGARISDAVCLGEGNIDHDGWLNFRQVKTGGEVSIPYDRELPTFAEDFAEDLAQLHRAINARNDRHVTFMTTRQGASRSAKSVSQWFARKVREAGIEGRTAHGLRKSRTIDLIEAEATTHQIGAWTGHESLKEIENYGKKYGRRRALSKTKKEQKVPTIPEKFQKKQKNETKTAS